MKTRVLYVFTYLANKADSDSVEATEGEQGTSGSPLSHCIDDSISFISIQV